MDILEAIAQRRSIRAFKSDSVPREVLTKIMEQALRAPSWANIQPWEFAIVDGAMLKEIQDAFAEKVGVPPYPDVARPVAFPEPYDARRRALGVKLFEVKGIGREDREQRKWWLTQGLRSFEAPSAIYICIDRSFYFQGEGINVWPIFDCGIIAGYIMLLASQYGLGTIPQIQAVDYPDILRKVLGIPDSKLIVLGIAVGYPDRDDPINQFRSEREPLDKIARWYGFD